MTNSSLSEGLITDEALVVFRTRIGSKLRVNNVFNKIASSEAIRKFADGIGDPNPLWRNRDYAKFTSYKQLPAPPSWVASVFPAWVLQGLPGVHAFQTSADWEFHRPVLENDRVVPECIFTDFRVLNSEFAGRSVLERQEARYYDQSNRLVARAKVAGLRAERSATRQEELMITWSYRIPGRSRNFRRLKQRSSPRRSGVILLVIGRMSKLGINYRKLCVVPWVFPISSPTASGHPRCKSRPTAWHWPNTASIRPGCFGIRRRARSSRFTVSITTSRPRVPPGFPILTIRRCSGIAG